MDIQYIGEMLLPGKLGHLAVNLSFLSALLSMVLYAVTARKGKALPSSRLAGALFSLHFILLLLAIGTLYFLILNHRFEYRYVWQYSSLDMSPKFAISCFWAGQEGSFFLWSFFQGLLGMVLLLSAKEWKAPVMAVMALSQAFVTSMLLGTEIGSFTIGGDPFVLLREVATPGDREFFANPDYLRMITDGNGLNPLLENPWMIIHPPVLFLGYAAVLVPFAYAVAALWTGRYHSWIKPVKPWLLFATLTLGMGILLGGAWAYVSLTFGGFWAWDPVENASLVPWLTLVAGLHFVMAGRNHNFSQLSAFIFVTFAYVMVLYASFLTRSGVLSETSVHSFGDNGLMIQLIAYTVVFFLLSIGLFVWRYKALTKKDKENILSREFWMFVGGMVVVLSAFQVVFSTSIPVINSIFGSNLAPPLNPVAYYNQWQLPYAFLIALIIGFSQYLKFGQNRGTSVWKKVMPGLVIALVLTALTAIAFRIVVAGYLILLFGLFFALVSSVAFWRSKRSSLLRSGAMISHFGFALFLIGVVITFTNEIVISQNTSRFDLSNAGSNQENQLMMRGDTVPMGPYAAVYADRWKEGTRTYFKVDFLRMDERGDWEHRFTLVPHINENLRMGNVYEPATANHLDKDVYAYLSFADLSLGDPGAPQDRIREDEVAAGDTLHFTGLRIVIDSLGVRERDEALENVRLQVYARVIGSEGEEIPLVPEYILEDGTVDNPSVSAEGLDFSMRFERVSDIPGAVWLGFYEPQRDFIVIKAIIFPYILIMWLGAAIMLAGLSVAMIRRVQPGS